MDAAAPSTLSISAETVHVELGSRSYDIVIAPGALSQLGERLCLLRPGSKAAIISDDRVEKLHGAAIRAAVNEQLPLAANITVPAGERSKSFAELERVVHGLLDAGLERRDVVIAFGGGVVGDLAGFAAAILHRGITLVQVPTTLLAQVDSAVGGKTGIDTSHGKNLVGAFHQPALVLSDTLLLDTLPEREMRAGYAETVKYGLIDDAPFFAWLEGAWREIMAGGPARIRAVATGCRAKARIVAADEREAGQRALLNLGHTFAHALETATGHSERLLHGEAVAIGMVMAFGLSAELGRCDPAVEARLARHLAAVGLPTKLSQIDAPLPPAERMIEMMLRDKKTSGGRLTFILAENIGQAFVARDVATDKLRDFLAERLGQP